jgi:glycosyltransferase involved in cell wall biosynthesis
MSLSVIIITKDAELKIASCLAAVKPIADEIIIIDSGSSDNTLAICQNYTDKIHERDWPGYGIQKQRALDLATQKWVLSLDADEEIEPNLRSAIASIANENNAKYDGYRIKRKMMFLGRLMNHAGNDSVLRLFKRSKGQFSPDKIHERVVMDGPIGHLPGYCIHYSYKSLKHWLDKMNDYTSLQALNKKEKKVKFGVTTAFIKGLFSFFKIYILKRGIADGKVGFIYAINGGINGFYKYLKIAFNENS